MGTFFIFIILLSSLNNVFAQPDNPFNVAAVGDISCNKNGKQTISSIENNHPNLVLFLGDLAYDNSLECFFDQTQVLENNETGNTVLVTIGNHDIDNGDGNKETKKQHMMHYNIPSAGYYSKIFDYDGSKILIVAMNFTGLEEQQERNKVKNSLENEQYNFVKDQLENSKATYKIVVSHAPFVSAECNSLLKLFRITPCHNPLEKWDNDLFTKYHTLFKNTKVDLVLSGHNHNYQREEKDGITYIISGLGGRSQYKLMDENDTHFANTYGFLQLMFYPEFVKGKFISNDLESKSRDNFTIKAN
jgi:predicted MPP superfamily phosphohydrolase